MLRGFNNMIFIGDRPIRVCSATSWGSLIEEVHELVGPILNITPKVYDWRMFDAWFNLGFN